MNLLAREDFAEIIKSSNVKPRLKRELRFVPDEITNWELRDFIAVTNKNKSEGVLIYQGNVVPFKLEKRAANGKGRVEAIICDICATWQRGSNSAAIIFTKEKSNVTFLVCQDLCCSLHVRDKTPEAKLSRTQLRENITLNERVDRLHLRLATILQDLT